MLNVHKYSGCVTWFVQSMESANTPRDTNNIIIVDFPIKPGDGSLYEASGRDAATILSRGLTNAVYFLRHKSCDKNKSAIIVVYAHLLFPRLLCTGTRKRSRRNVHMPRFRPRQMCIVSRMLECCCAYTPRNE